VKYHLLGISACRVRLAARHAGRHRPPRDRRADEHRAEEREEVRADVVEEDRLLGSLRRRAALEDGRLHAAVLVESAMRFLLMILVALALGAEAKTVRSAGAKARFAREHPCPATGRRLTSCPGYVIDHIDAAVRRRRRRAREHAMADCRGREGEGPLGTRALPAATLRASHGRRAQCRPNCPLTSPP
jgi:hypothetical protein